MTQIEELKTELQTTVARLATNQQVSLEFVLIEYLEDWAEYNIVLRKGDRQYVIELPIRQVIQAKCIGALQGFLRRHVEIAWLFLR